MFNEFDFNCHVVMLGTTLWLPSLARVGEQICIVTKVKSCAACGSGGMACPSGAAACRDCRTWCLPVRGYKPVRNGNVQQRMKKRKKD